MVEAELNWGYVGLLTQLAFGGVGLAAGVATGVLTRSRGPAVPALSAVALLMTAWAVQVAIGFGEGPAFGSLYLAIVAVPLGCLLARRF